jgi:CelD/BcsL family acetyltransferase involved in cellulose biosynthesis
MAARMEVDLYADDIDSILPEWEALFEADPAATPFSSPQWARAWWPHWAGSAVPWLVLVREGGRVAGLAPLVLRRRGPFRVLAPLGRDPSNYWDVLALPDRREGVAVAVAGALAERVGDWDAIALGGVPAGAAIGPALEGAGLRVNRRDPVPHPGIELPASFEDYLAALPAKRRKDLRRHLRRLDEGEVARRELTGDGEIAAAVETWQDLRVRWWRERGRMLNPEHASPRFRGFVSDLMRLLVPAGLGLVWEYRHRDELVGVELSLVTERSFYAWLDGYEPAAARLGIGKLAVGDGIRSSIAAGRSYFDFMVGAESYKYWFGARDRHCEWLMSSHGAVRSRAARAAGRLAEARAARSAAA